MKEESENIIFRKESLWWVPGTEFSFVYRTKGMLKELSTINLEIAQMVVASNEAPLQDWFLVEVAQDFPKFL